LIFEEETHPIMAEVIAFTTHLTAIGFDNAARTALAMQGLQIDSDLLSFTMPKDLERLITHCQNEVHNMARDLDVPRPVFPFLAVKKLHAFFYLWTISKGQPTSPELFLLLVMTQ
jgi:hypothetical protein